MRFTDKVSDLVFVHLTLSQGIQVRSDQPLSQPEGASAVDGARSYRIRG